MNNRHLSIDRVLRLDSINWRYWSCDDRSRALWTTEPLYTGGDFLAALLDADHNIIEKRYFARRKDAKQAAKWWYLERSAYCEYVIRELP